MTSTATPPDPRKILWVAFSSTPLFFGVVAHMLVRPPAGFPVALPSPSQPLGMALAVLALGSFAFSFIVHQGETRRDERRADPRWIMRLALGESIAIYGLMATMLTRVPGTWVPFTVLSLIALAAAYPKTEP